MLEGHHMTQRERGRKRGEREFRGCYFLMQSALRPVFFLKDHQASSKEICETERTNCQPGSQSRMTAFHRPPRLPPRYSSSSCLSTRLSSSSPSTGHNYSMKKNDFPKQHHPPHIPWSESKAWTRQQGQVQEIFGGFLLLCSQIRNKVKVTTSCIFICWRWLKNVMHSFSIHLFLQFDRTLIGADMVNFTLLITNFPSKATTITATQTTTAASSFHIWGYI